MGNESNREPDPQSDPLYVALEGLNFYAYNTAETVAKDGGAIARETIQAINELFKPKANAQ